MVVKNISICFTVSGIFGVQSVLGRSLNKPFFIGNEHPNKKIL